MGAEEVEEGVGAEEVGAEEAGAEGEGDAGGSKGCPDEADSSAAARA